MAEQGTNAASQPHDSFFKFAFSKPHIARLFFQYFLHPDIVAAYDFTTLQEIDTSLIDKSLKTLRADLVFQVQLAKDPGNQAYLVLEHKSYADPWAGYQLLGYAKSLWDWEMSKGRRQTLSAVIPLLAYHGERVWQPPSFADLIDAPECLSSLKPQFPFVLCDLHREPLDQLEAKPWLAIPLRVLKYIKDKTLPERLPGILSLFRQLGSEGREVRDFLDAVLNYLVQAAEHLDEDSIDETLKRVLPEFYGKGGVSMATIAQNWMAEGEARGMEQGRTVGFEQHARQTLQRQLAHKFGPLPDHFEQRIEQAGQPELDHWLDQVLDATSLENVFS